MLVGECFPIVLTVMQQLFSGVEELECFHWKVSVEGFSECCVSFQLVGASLKWKLWMLCYTALTSSNTGIQKCLFKAKKTSYLNVNTLKVIICSY